jgi:CheY-like chemotaxis protein
LPHHQRILFERLVLSRYRIGVGTASATYKTDKGIVTEMSCEKISREIPNYIKGKHGTAMRASIEEHLKDCKHCTAALGGAGNVVRLATGAATFDLRAGHSNRLDEKASRKRKQERRRTNQRTVFYVDDNPKAQRILTFALEWVGYKVITSCNAEALERMKQTSSDLVLLAYRTPQMIGSELTRDIKELNPDIPILLISGHRLLAPEELTHVNAYVGGGATLDSLLAQVRVLLAPASYKSS